MNVALSTSFTTKQQPIVSTAYPELPPAKRINIKTAVGKCLQTDGVNALKYDECLPDKMFDFRIDYTLTDSTGKFCFVKRYTNQLWFVKFSETNRFYSSCLKFKITRRAVGWDVIVWEGFGIERGKCVTMVGNSIETIECTEDEGSFCSVD